MKVIECHTLMFVKRAQTVHNKSTLISLSWWISNGCSMWTQSETSVWVWNYLVCYWGHFSQAAGTYANVFIPVQNRVLMAHQLSLLRICQSFIKSTNNAPGKWGEILSLMNNIWINLYTNNTLNYGT